MFSSRFNELMNASVLETNIFSGDIVIDFACRLENSRQQHHPLINIAEMVFGAL